MKSNTYTDEARFTVQVGFETEGRERFCRRQNRDGHLMASRPPCDRLYRPVAAFFSQQGPAPASSGGAEGEHPLDVPCHGHEAPLAAHLVEPAQQELAESEYRFDDAEHRFRGLFAQSIELPAFWRFQPMRHGLDRRWVFRRGRCI